MCQTQNRLEVPHRPQQKTYKATFRISACKDSSELETLLFWFLCLFLAFFLPASSGMKSFVSCGWDFWAHAVELTLQRPVWDTSHYAALVNSYPLLWKQCPASTLNWRIWLSNGRTACGAGFLGLGMLGDGGEASEFRDLKRQRRWADELGMFSERCYNDSDL